MLVLTRKQDEQILIGDDIVVTILRVKGNTIRVGIEAPKGVRVIRAELQTAVNNSEPTVKPETIDSKKDRPQASRNSLRVAHTDRSVPNSGPLGSYVLAARIPLPNLATDLNSRVG